VGRGVRRSPLWRLDALLLLVEELEEVELGLLVVVLGELEELGLLVAVLGELVQGPVQELVPDNLEPVLEPVLERVLERGPVLEEP